MWLFSKNADVQETERPASGSRIKTFRLNKPLTEEAISALASDTLRAGGWAEPPLGPKVGGTMPDGTVYAGISPDSNKQMYAMPADASLTMTFNEAKEYAAKLDAHGHKDWRVPTKAELNVLFNNRAEIGGFDISGSHPAGRYWSSWRSGEWNAWGKFFNGGGRNYDVEDNHSSVRLVR